MTESADFKAALGAVYAAIDDLHKISDGNGDDAALDEATDVVNTAIDDLLAIRPLTAWGIIEQLSVVLKYEAETIEPAHLPIFEHALEIRAQGAGL